MNKEKEIIESFKDYYNSAEKNYNEEYASGLRFGLKIGLSILTVYGILNKKDINNIWGRRIFIDEK